MSPFSGETPEAIAKASARGTATIPTISPARRSAESCALVEPRRTGNVLGREACGGGARGAESSSRGWVVLTKTLSRPIKRRQNGDGRLETQRVTGRRQLFRTLTARSARERRVL